MSQENNRTPSPDYFAARAVEERRLAMATTDARARAAHLELAERYAVLARSGDYDQPEVIGEQQRAG